MGHQGYMLYRTAVGLQLIMQAPCVNTARSPDSHQTVIRKGYRKNAKCLCAFVCVDLKQTNKTLKNTLKGPML